MFSNYEFEYQLQLAVCHNDLVTLEFLLQEGIDANQTVDLGRLTSMLQARDIITQPLPINQQTTTLHVAVATGSLEAVKLLLQYGAEVDARIHPGLTLLMVAVAGGRQEVAELLLNAGAEVDARNNSGRTALQYAMRAHDFPMMSMLMHRGADESTLIFPKPMSDP